MQRDLLHHAAKAKAKVVATVPPIRTTRDVLRGRDLRVHGRMVRALAVVIAADRRAPAARLIQVSRVSATVIRRSAARARSTWNRVVMPAARRLVAVVRRGRIRRRSPSSNVARA